MIARLMARSRSAEHPARAVAAALAFVVLTVAVSGCGTAVAAWTAPARSAVPPQPSRSVQDATRTATIAYQQDLARAGAAFSADLERLATAARAGDTEAARTAELAAQADEDAFRSQIGAGSATALALDGRPADLPAGDTLAGLHSVERGLWHSGDDPLPAVQALVAAGPALEELLSRVELSPSAILRSGIETLGWVNAVAVPGREEVFSHLDTVDVAAGVTAARSAFTAVAPLGDLVAPTAAATVRLRFADLARAVAALGPPGTRPDQDVPPGAETGVARQVDATAAALSTLAAQLDTGSATPHYGPAGPRW